MALLSRWRSGREARERAHALYAGAVARARTPAFYADWGVPDTVDGRFDMVVLHAFLVLERLKREGAAGRRLSQALFDLMFRDMDRSVRELGVGDHAIGRRIKQMISAFYGRVKAYTEALDDAARLGEALRRNVYREGAVDDEALAHLTAYVLQAHRELAAWPLENLLRGELPAPGGAASGTPEMH